MDVVTFHLDGRPLGCRIRISDKARRVSLRMTDSGLEIVRPKRIRIFAPDALLNRFSPWIRRQLIRHEAREADRRNLDGKILLRGITVPVSFRPDLFPSVSQSAAGIVVSAPIPQQAPELLRRWVFDAARTDLQEALTRRSTEMNQPYGRLMVRDQKWLWGSCSPGSGTISLNVRLLMAPPPTLDYIVVHELAHFRWRGHGTRFWDLVGRYCPDYKAHRRWLRVNSARLRFPEAFASLDKATA